LESDDGHFNGSALLLGLSSCAERKEEKKESSKGEEAATIQQKVQSMLQHVEGGLTTIDAADNYGDSETIISEFLKVHGAQHPIEICTKWCPRPGPMTYEVVERAVQQSLDRLFPDSMIGDGRVIDVLHFHWCDYSDTRYVDALANLSLLQQSGTMIRHIALTNFDSAHLRVVVASGLLTLWNQVHCSLLDSRSAKEMTTTCSSLSKIQTVPCKLVVYGALAGGFLTDKWLGANEPDMSAPSCTWMEMKYKRFIDAWGGWTLFQELLQCLRRIADELNQVREEEDGGTRPLNIAR
jgi:aryl-alcohol dehydrogenase-like predicted oxidoreductase